MGQNSRLESDTDITETGRVLPRCVVLVDTSVLLLISEGLASLEDFIQSVQGCRIIVPDFVVEELKKLALQGGKRGKLASWALSKIIPRFEVVEFGIGVNTVDDALLTLAQRLGAAIATADVELRGRARHRGIRTIYYWTAKRRFISD